METKNILLTAGPIPGKLDSVKYVTNRFKGGLMFKLALQLSVFMHHRITIVKWKHTELPANLKGETGIGGRVTVVDVDDVNDYYAKVLEKEYDAYILGAAVANLVPSNPWPGKFPSHNYKVGDKFPIEFEIAPRVIDEVKKKFPRSLLIGYKLFDGEPNELVKAGWKTLTEGKCNVVFCNHPAWAKEKKIALLPDGSRHEMTFDEHLMFIDRMLKLKWYKSEINKEKTEIPAEIIECLESKLKWITQNATPELKEFSDYDFGTVAMRYKDGFVTTTRGKFRNEKDNVFTYVSGVDHGTRTVHADTKATLNAPMLAKLFENAPEDYNLIIHGHFSLPEEKMYEYLFPGTTEENEAADNLSCNIKGHGCYLVTKCGNNNTE